MTIISVEDIYLNKIKIGSVISVRGWVRNRRKSKLGLSFIDMYDGSILNTIQIIANSCLDNYYNEIIKLTVGCSIVVNGILTKSLGLKQKYEIKAKQVRLVGLVDNPDRYPVTSKKHTLEHLRHFVHLRPRTSFIGAISRIRNCLFHSLNHFFYQQKYYWISTPIITGLNAEGAGNMFRVSTLNFENIPIDKKGQVNFKKDFFNKESFLSVSGQLTLEAYVCALSKVYSFGPIFRAENSNTSRHLAEFWMLEVESAFLNLADIIILSEKMLKNSVNFILEQCSNDLCFFESHIDKNIFNRLEMFVKKKFFQIEYKEAINILKKSQRFFNNDLIFGIELSTEHERYLVEDYFGFPVIIINYPKSIKAFYMRSNDDNLTVAAMDILVPKIGEIIGGSEREDRLHILDQQLNKHKLNNQDYYWYRDLRRYGSVPHSGFGLGFERFLCYLLGVNNIKDVSPFPRTIHKSDF